MESSFLKSPKNGYGSLVLRSDDIWLSPNADTESTQTEDPKTLIIYEHLDEKWLKRRVWINVLLLNVGLFFLYTGMAPIGMLQSSLNADEGLGVASLAIKNAFMVVGSVVAPTVLRRFGCKMSLVLGTVVYITYVPANFYPSWWTLVPFAVLGGLGCTVEATARKVYIARLAHLYTELTKADVDRINSRLFVIMICAIKLSATLGDFVSSIILDAGAANNEPFEQSRLGMCGIDYCNQKLEDVYSVNSSAVQVETEAEVRIRVYVLVAFCTLCCIVAVVIFAFLDTLKTFGISSSADQPYSSPMAVLKDLFFEMKDPKHLLFIPMTMALSGGDTFWTADFNKAFITCSMGMAYLGYVAIWNGLSAATSCLLLGWFNQKNMRSFPVACATLLQMVTYIALFYWTPTHTLMTNYWTLSILSIVFFFGSGIRHFIAPVLISVVFKNKLETAFSVYHFWIYLSSTLFYAWSNLVCVTFKVYFLMATLALSFIGYIGIEYLVQRQLSNEEKYRNLKTDGEDGEE